MSYSGKFKDKDNNLHPVTSVLYGTCDTAAATAAKVVTCSDFDRLMTGVTIRVKFTYGNTAASPTVNINNTGATAVYCYGSTAPVGGTSWQAGAVVELVYDGTSFFIVGSATSGSDDIVAAEFSTATTYAAGDYCIYDGGLYKFKTSHTGAWAAADVDSITVTGELKGKQDIFERISYADWQLLSPQQQAAKPYYIYDYPSTQITAANVSYDHTQSGLSATTAQGGIDELASEKQDATDNNLTTTNKTIVGGINEIKSGLTNVADDVKLNTQDLTTPSRTKNVLPLSLQLIKSSNTVGTWNNNEYTIGGCVFTVNTNAQGIVTSIDVSNANTTTYVSALYIPLPKNNNKYKFGGGGGNNYNIILWDNTTNARAKKWDGSTDSDASTNTTALWEVLNVASDSIELRCRVNANTPAGSSTYYPLLVGEDETDPSFAPYIPSVESRIEAVESGLNEVNSNITKKTTVISETNAIGNAYNIAGVICLAIYDGGQFSCNVNDVIFTLPAGFRPSAEVQVVNTASGHERILINSSGQVIAKEAFNNSYARFTITFM